MVQAAVTLVRMAARGNPLLYMPHAGRRTRVAVLALALCMWLIAAVTHSHGDELPVNEPSNACSFCLSLPTGAPAPAHTPEARRVLVATAKIAEFIAAAVVLAVPSSYSSRGPPAL